MTEPVRASDGSIEMYPETTSQLFTEVATAGKTFADSLPDDQFRCGLVAQLGNGRMGKAVQSLLSVSLEMSDQKGPLGSVGKSCENTAANGKQAVKMYEEGDFLAADAYSPAPWQ